MSQKIFDVRPRSVSRKKAIKKSASRNTKWMITIGIVLVVVSVAAYLQFSAKVRVEIWPKYRDVSLSKELTVETSNLVPDFAKGIIGGRFAAAEKESSETFVATGEASQEGKAGGKIEVINNYHLSQILVAKTRFLSGDGKLFYSKEKITVFAGERKEVAVEAAEAGPDYNIKPSTFSLPGLLGSPRYTFVYAESKSSMAGGYIGKMAMVTGNDLKEAEKELSEKLAEELKKEMQDSVGENLSILENAIKFETISKSSSAKEKDTVETFTLRLKVSGQSLAFNQDSLKDWAGYWISQSLDASQKIKDTSLEINPTVQSVDFKAGKLFLKTDVSALAFEEISSNEFKLTLAGKTIKEGEIILSSLPQLEKAKMEVFPFWLAKISENQDRIEIKLNLE